MITSQLTYAYCAQLVLLVIDLGLLITNGFAKKLYVLVCLNVINIIAYIFLLSAMKNMTVEKEKMNYHVQCHRVLDYCNVEVKNDVSVKRKYVMIISNAFILWMMKWIAIRVQ